MTGKKIFDKEGRELTKSGILIRKDLNFEYKKIALFKQRNKYELMNEALERYLPELRKPTRERLKEAGQTELNIE
jgi:hypothetical protein